MADPADADPAAADDDAPVRKDTLENIRAAGALCVNVVTEGQLDAMNATSASVGPEVDEFALAALDMVASERVHAPYVRGCPAVLDAKHVTRSPSRNPRTPW